MVTHDAQERPHRSLDIPLNDDGLVPFHRTAYELVVRCTEAEIPGAVVGEAKSTWRRHDGATMHVGSRPSGQGNLLCMPTGLPLPPSPTPPRRGRAEAQAGPHDPPLPHAPYARAAGRHHELPGRLRWAGWVACSTASGLHCCAHCLAHCGINAAHHLPLRLPAWLQPGHADPI